MSNIFKDFAVTDPDRYRTLNQDDWKRTQVRLPQEVYEQLSKFAKTNKLSLNSAIVTLIEQGLNPISQPTSMININIKDYLSEQAIKVFDEEFGQIRQKLRSKFKDVSQDDLDKFLAHLLEQ